MTIRTDNIASNALVDSVATAQLRSGVRLRFANADLENDFRRAHRETSRHGVRTHLWLAVALLFIFLVIDRQLLQHVATPLLSLVRIVASASLFICAFAASTSWSIHRHYHHFVQWLAPLFGLCVVANNFISQPVGVSFFPTVLLVVVGLYQLVGMLFLPALCAGLMMLVAYMIGAWQQQLAQPEFVFNVAILIAANAAGATASYMMERLQRLHFLEARLLEDIASRDGLTGIHNRRAFDEHLQTIWRHGIRDATPLALILIDIDQFKAYNDYFGHQAGDECLKEVAGILMRACRRPLDFAARYGGEEFALVLYNARREHAEEIAANIQNELRKLALIHPASNVAEQVTISIGSACVQPVHGRSSAGMIQFADQALYRAKGSGRNCSVILDQEYEQLITGKYRKEDAQTMRKVS